MSTTDRKTLIARLNNYCITHELPKAVTGGMAQTGRVLTGSLAA